MKVKYVVVTFGNLEERYILAHLAILSLKARVSGPYEIVVVTDREDKYRYLKEHVSFFKVDEEILREYGGEHNFGWRFKIRVLQDLISDDCHIVSIDSDTFCFNSLDKLVSMLDNGVNFLHKKEYILSKYRSKRNNRIYKTIKNRRFGAVTINESTSMINAGVVGISALGGDKILKEILECCDLLCKENIPIYYLEQLSFSAILEQNYKLSYADEFFIHYWGNKKEWMMYLQGLLSQFLMQNFDVDMAVKFIANQRPNFKSVKKDPWIEG